MQKIQVLTDFKALDDLVVVNLEVSLWSAQKKMAPEDLGAKNLPPEELATLGSKRVADPKSLLIFKTLKCRANTLLERNGIRFLNGYAIPASKAPMIVEELIKIRTDFNNAKNAFLAGYDEDIEAWIAKHQEWGDIIRNSTDSSEYVRSRMDFRWHLFRVYPASDKKDSIVGLESGLAEEVTGLGSTLFAEVASAADDMLRRVYEGRDEVNHKALSPLRTLRDKLAGLTFVEPRVAPVVALVDEAIKRIPRRGNINGPDLLMLRGLVQMLKDTDTLVEEAQRLIEGNAPTSVLDAILNQSLPASDLSVDGFTVDAPVPTTSASHNEQRFDPPMVAKSTPNINSLGLW